MDIMLVEEPAFLSAEYATMMYAVHKIKKDNTIDALKNENL